MDSQFFYSVVIPHYNIPRLLKRCLNSIPQRSDVQVIVVDDCSNSDNCLLLKKMEDEFPHVIFLYSERNQGGGAARNMGLEKACGKYILFADADDFFTPCFNDVLDEYKSRQFDVAFFNACSVDAETLLPTKRASYVNKLHKLHRFFPNKAEHLLKYAFGEPWCKIVNLDFIKRNKISFECTKIHNDTKFSYMVGFLSKKNVVDGRALYCITERLNSVSKGQSFEKQMTRLRVFAEKNLFLKKNGVRFVDEQIYYPFVYFLQQRDEVALEKSYALLKNEYSYNLIAFSFQLRKFIVLSKLKKFIKKLFL